MSRKTKKPKARGGHLKAVPSAPRLPLQLVLNHRSVDSLTPDFVHWFEKFGDAPDALQCLEVVKLFMTTSHAVSNQSSATRIDPDTVEDAAIGLVGVLDEADTDEALDEVYDYLHLYVDFLSETGRWSGSQEEYSVVHAFLTEGAPDFPPLNLPELTAEEQDQAFRELPVLELANRLLEWLEEGKDVTSTRALRLKDVEGAAAAVGVNAKGKRGGKRTLAPEVEEDGRAQSQSETFEVRSMHDVPVLREIWAALVDSRILSVGATRAVPGAGADSWHSQDPESRLRIRREFLVVFLASAVMNSGSIFQEGFDQLLATVLIKGTTGEPMGVEELSKSAEPGAGDDIFLAFSARRTRIQLAKLAELGLIQVDTHYTVSPVVIQCVPPALALVLALEDFEPPVTRPIRQRPGREPPVE
ncbi:hypothetical protein ABH924_003505 [Arthrobacter sp. GAS37]|uniref:hypothetical protein n=1 Tax=Arthrobacter sp. GAS37 TaxID=3156261 RepID=UPI0038388DA6